MGNGWILAAKVTPSSCATLHHWLLWYCIALTMLPFCIGIAGPLVIWWSVDGALVRSQTPEACQRDFPALWDFVDQVTYFGLGTFGIMLLAVLTSCCCRWRLRWLQDFWGEGRALEAVIRCVEQAPAADVPAGHECTICLESFVEGTIWRALPCSHVFHRDCILEWLSHGRRCPLCRLDLHEAYLGTGPSGDPLLNQPPAMGEMAA